MVCASGFDVRRSSETKRVRVVSGCGSLRRIGVAGGGICSLHWWGGIIVTRVCGSKCAPVVGRMVGNWEIWDPGGSTELRLGPGGVAGRRRVLVGRSIRSRTGLPTVRMNVAVLSILGSFAAVLILRERDRGQTVSGSRMRGWKKKRKDRDRV